MLNSSLQLNRSNRINSLNQFVTEDTFSGGS
jgi:hypothetical protein